MEGRTEDGGSDRGSATIWVLVVMAMVWFLVVALLFVGSARIARHRAQSAADLSALAGAVRAFAAPEEACPRARALAEANRVSLTRCAVRAGVVDVRVAVRIVLPWLGEQSATADARAGPR
ncbi:Rv3654c family TadE-like protein [Sphaerisporangium corydalis]|uniref:Rv3654c family TadE-like protein n=1 Tax=Sphaerisporangium corydalis TaxID=1441875 RepID=UPI0021D17033|nr:Rv3654c family TadE-like protein [Sphaerisporangium corydalis]